MPPGTILQLMVGIVALALLWTTWWFKRNDSKQKDKDDNDKKIDEATSSGNISLINAIIQRLRGK